jgi:hypothetical protein
VELLLRVGGRGGVSFFRFNRGEVGDVKKAKRIWIDSYLADSFLRSRHGDFCCIEESQVGRFVSREKVFG